MMEEILADDLLGHEDFSGNIYQRMEDFPSGTVVSLEGDWGRGKTDLLSRLYEKCVTHERIWVNPWAHQESIILETIARIQEATGELPDDQLIRAGLEAVRMSKFGVRTGQVALSVTKPILSPIIKAGADLGAAGLEQLKVYLEARKNQRNARPGEVFKELIDVLLVGASGRGKKPDKVTFFIDDMDRCTPEGQVNLLEQVHSLTKSGAKAVFFVAVDSTVLSRSIRHYYGDHFEGHLYLEKIFTLRLHLPQISPAEVAKLVNSQLTELKAWLKERTTETTLKSKDLEESLRFLGRRTTPRMIERIVFKARYLLRGERVEPDDVPLALIWLTLTQAFPETRRAFLNFVSKGKSLLDQFNEPQPRFFPISRRLEDASKDPEPPWFEDSSRQVLVDGNLVHESGIEMLRFGRQMYEDNEAFEASALRVENLFRDSGLL